jgi:MYXO-CTERM domain-containing protein
MTLGGDVLGAPIQPWDAVLTRLHARYGKDLKDDLVFKAAPPIVGGRELPQANGKLEERSQPSSENNFQGRYAIRHEWTGPIKCDQPVRGRWGGPPAGVAGGETRAAKDLAFAPRGVAKLPELVRQDVPEIDVKADRTAGGPATAAAAGAGSGAGSTTSTPKTTRTEKKSGCGCAAGDAGGRDLAGGGVLALAALGVIVRRRRDGESKE